MNTYTVTKDNGITKIHNGVKQRIQEIVMEALAKEFGAENVAMVRIESSSSASNEIGVIAGTLIDEGCECDLCQTVKVTTKSHKEKVTKKYTIPAFDFITAREKYEAWETDQIEKELNKKTTKSTKNAKNAEKEQRAEEVKQAIKNVKEKQNK